jgi:molybdate/tungstate transport system substrate-binding protein
MNRLTATRATWPKRTRRLAAGALGATAIMLAAGSSASGAVSTRSPSASTAASGAVSALFAGSLLNYMEHDFGPSFAKATGYGYKGFGGGSTEVAAQIKGGVREGDVFISAAAAADNLLEGPMNGNWVSWHTTFAASPLMLAYNPSSSFGRQLAEGKPWYRVLTEPSILVGRTDPKLDPKGILTVEAVENAARKLREPALSTALSSFPVYPETALVGRLQSGQLDAGFFYAVEASSAKLSTVSLSPVYKVADYTLTILDKAPNPTGAAAFVRYLLNAQRSYTLKKNGLTALKPAFSGKVVSVPRNLRQLVGATKPVKTKQTKQK